MLPHNFRARSATLEQVTGWAWPRQVLSFWLPDVFGNPSHHRWIDLWTRQWTPATTNALGEPARTIFWGIKNYVEGGSYLSIAAWLLAAVAVLSGLWRSLRPRLSSGKAETARKVNTPRPVHLWFFAALAPISLLFAFGTPLYALLFYGLPGWNQLHSPFRWVFPFTVSMALLAGMGLHELLALAAGSIDGRGRDWPRRLARAVVALIGLAGFAALALVALSLLRAEPFIALGQRLVDGSDLAQMAFRDGRMFWSYQAMNLARFGLFALFSAGPRGCCCAGGRPHRQPSLAALLVVVIADLFVAHGRFNPAATWRCRR